MLAIGYFDGIHRRGLLVFRSVDGERHALGGFDPGDESAAADPQTVITTDTSETVLEGWVHPSYIGEVVGEHLVAAA